jgi:phospholipase C
LSLAGLAMAGTASGRAARATTAFPTPISHVVWIYQENHTFDNVLGAHCVENGNRCSTCLPYFEAR